jgi:hypothetical protein
LSAEAPPPPPPPVDPRTTCHVVPAVDVHVTVCSVVCHVVIPAPPSQAAPPTPPTSPSPLDHYKNKLEITTKEESEALTPSQAKIVRNALKLASITKSKSIKRINKEK